MCAIAWPSASISPRPQWDSYASYRFAQIISPPLLSSQTLPRLPLKAAALPLPTYVLLCLPLSPAFRQALSAVLQRQYAIVALCSCIASGRTLLVAPSPPCFSCTVPPHPGPRHPGLATVALLPPFSTPSSPLPDIVVVVVVFHFFIGLHYLHYKLLLFPFLFLVVVVIVVNCHSPAGSVEQYYNKSHTEFLYNPRHVLAVSWRRCKPCSRSGNAGQPGTLG